MSEYFEIAYAAAAKRLCLFTGTGFSKALSTNVAPGWQELLEAICDKFIGNKDFKEALFPAAGVNALQLDEAAQVISIELLKNGKNVHDEIASLISGVTLSGSYPETEKFFRERSFRVVTTNYDKLAEILAGTDCQSLSPGRPTSNLEGRQQGDRQQTGKWAYQLQRAKTAKAVRLPLRPAKRAAAGA